MTSIATRIIRRIQKRIRITRYAQTADSFLVSYPKSGRTWFRYILSHYFGAIAGMMDPVDLHNMFSIVPNFDLDPVRGIPAFRFQDGDSRVPKIWVSHLEYRSSLFLSRPVIMMVRDPRDVIVSAYFHATRHKHRYEGTIGQFLDDEAQGLPAMCRYLNGWAGGIGRRRHHVLSYEALSANTPGEVRSALEFLKCPVDAKALHAAVEAGRFEAMQDRERVEGLPAHEYDRSDTESMRMRRGQAGGFGDYLDAGLVEHVEAVCRKRLSSAARKLVSNTGFVI